LKKGLLITLILMILLIGSTTLHASISTDTLTKQTLERFPLSIQIQEKIGNEYTLVQVTNQDSIGNNYPLGLPPDENIQITNTDELENHPALGIDIDENPFLLYDFGESSFSSDSDIYIRRSLDGGGSWSDDHIWKWESDGSYEFRPDVSIMADGLRAFGTHEVDILEPTIYLHDYVNVKMPESWVMYYFDLSPEISYVKDTTVTTYSINTIALAGVVDFNYHEYDLDDTVVVFWNTDTGRDTWPGLFMINTDNDGNIQPVSHLTSGSGDKVFIVYQLEDIDSGSDIYVAYCPSTELVFEKWRITSITNTKSDTTNPSMAVSGKYAYVVCQDNQNGNEDIVCFSTTSGHFWRKKVITNFPGDELSPVISADGEKATCLYIKDGNLYEIKTQDAGLSWNEPVQINDVDGTVSEGYRYTDAAGIYGVWTEKRNQNYDLFIDEVGPSPILAIGDIMGGLNVKTTISNTGNAPEKNLRWTIEIDGYAIPESKTGRITSLDEDEIVEIKTDFFFGFGPISITVTAGHLIKGIQGMGFGPYLVIS